MHVKLKRFWHISLVKNMWYWSEKIRLGPHHYWTQKSEDVFFFRPRGCFSVRQIEKEKRFLEILFLDHV